jgi:hypothetical protein
MDGLLVLVCASAVLAADSQTNPTPDAGASETVVARTLAVQAALQQGKEQLLHGDYRAGVATLEAQLAYINGNQFYLKLLQDAYRGYVKELRLAKREDEAQRYFRRLLILDKSAVFGPPLRGQGAAAAATSQVRAKPARPAPVVRLKSAEDPFDASNAASMAEPQAAVLARADQEFEHKHYREAALLYEQGQPELNAQRDRWGYAKLSQVVERINQAEHAPPAWPDLEEQVRVAINLAPRLDAYGRFLLKEIERARAEAVAGGQEERPAIAVHHLPADASGWSVAETGSFRIFHKQSPDFAEKAADVAEKTRASMQQKWFGSVEEPWSLKCDLYLHPTAEDYSKATGQNNSPGHSSFRVENGRLVQRRIDLHCDDPNLLTAVLPHETTHVVLAGAFGGRLLPRWADEGMAVLAEPRPKIERHLTNLVSCRQREELFHLGVLLQLEDYPTNPQHVGAFYAESVSVVEFLTQQRGPQEFTFFLHDGLRYGFEKSLQRHYNYASFADLEKRWVEYAFPPAGTRQVAEQTQ